MKKIVITLLVSILISCNSKTEFDDQIKKDLVAMLFNKAEVTDVTVTDIADIDSQTQKVTFDCNLHFIEDLRKDNGTIAFQKGMSIKEKGNVFYYSQNASVLKLVKLEFGETISIKSHN